MKNQVVLVTGATGGIGAACARLFAESGAIVVLAARNRAKADELAASINASGAEAYATDLEATDEKAVAEMVAKTTAELGSIDVLVNAFGTGMIKPLADVDLQQARKVLDVNVYGTIVVTKAVLSQMMVRKSGKVVMFPGILGKHAMRNSSVYSASKFAVTGFTKALVEETRRFNIGYSLLYLGGVDTQFWDNEAVDMRVQTDKMLRPEQVANAVHFAVNQPAPGVLNEMVIQPDSHQMV